MFTKFSIINDEKIIDVDLRVWYTVKVYYTDSRKFTIFSIAD
jgi:hypothetical protein